MELTERMTEVSKQKDCEWRNGSLKIKKIHIIALLVLIGLSYYVAISQPKPILRSDQTIEVFHVRYGDREMDESKLDNRKIAEVLRNYQCQYHFRRAGCYCGDDYPIQITMDCFNCKTGERESGIIDLLMGEDVTVSGECYTRLYTVINADQLRSELIPLIAVGEHSDHCENL